MIVAAPLVTPAAAVIGAVPAATPVTRPVDEAVATERFELGQVNDATFFGLAVAVSCSVRPASTVALAG